MPLEMFFSFFLLQKLDFTCNEVTVTFSAGYFGTKTPKAAVN
jgi:hypothetical protein